MGYTNDAGKFTTFSVAIPGIRTDVLVTDEVIDKMLYLGVFAYPPVSACSRIT